MKQWEILIVGTVISYTRYDLNPVEIITHPLMHFLCGRNITIPSQALGNLAIYKLQAKQVLIEHMMNQIMISLYT